MMYKLKGFTLIELLIVIVIIGILATALIPRLTGIQAKARDTKRIADLKQIQTALEMYHNEQGSYPNTFIGVDPMKRYRGTCPGYGGYDTQGISGYVPGLAPNFMSQLPVDPKPKDDRTCYLYKSDGKDYIVMAHGGVEGKLIPEFVRPTDPNQKVFAIYTPGGKNW